MPPNGDREARAANFVAAMAALDALIEGQAPGLSVPSETVKPLVSLLAAEARAVVTPDLRPGAVNDRA